MIIECIIFKSPRCREQTASGTFSCFINRCLFVWFFLSVKRRKMRKRSAMEWYMVTCFNLELIVSAIIFRFMPNASVVLLFCGRCHTALSQIIILIFPSLWLAQLLLLYDSVSSVQCLFTGCSRRHFDVYQLNRDDIYFFRVCHCI